MKREISQKKQELIDIFNNSDLQVGESIYLTEDTCKDTYHFSKNTIYDIVSIDGEDISIKSYNSSIRKIKKDNVKYRISQMKIGENPFDDKYRSVRSVPYQLESIIFNLDLTHDKREKPIVMNGIEVSEVNWNPYVFINNEKKYYQREYVWSLEQKQLLIESIYKGISCGTILVRLRSWSTLEKMAKSGETELSFKDIVDGKQRLKAIEQFINNDFMDLHGNYYSDLSSNSQNMFGNNNLLNYAEMDDSTSDEEVLYQFLKMNFEGVPQSKEHLQYVESLLK